MLSLAIGTRVFVALAAVDMRKGFNGLSVYVQRVLEQQVVGSGAVFVFTNQRRDRVS